MNCHKCGRVMVPPAGPAEADVLLVATAPTVFDVRAGRPWTGPGGDVLRTELRRAGLSYDKCRVTNMWRHAKTKECEADIDHVLAEMQDRRAVLLMGADAVTFFVGFNVSDVSGLRVDTMVDGMIPKSVGMAFALFNPAIATHDKLGEVRLGIERFVEAVREVQEVRAN